MVNFTEFKKLPYAESPHFMLIGDPVVHSLSPLMHNTAAEYYDLDIRYFAVQVTSAELSLLAAHFNKESFRGANVTIPHKQIMMDFVDELDRDCAKIGAVNTIVNRDFRLIGYNTDIDGFCGPLKTFSDEIEGTRAIVFGTGGAARAIAFGLMDFGVEEMMLVSRNPDKINSETWPVFTEIISYDAWPDFTEEASLIVNATPLGMDPKIDASPVNDDETIFLAEKICYDIIYKPLQTKFLQQAKSAGAEIIGGLEMLIQQGSRSFELWTGKTFPIDLVRKKLKQQFHG